ncbi:MAG TPA: Gfo/Idh/MocA family oxidoreductase [Mycobacteriales bacterium]|jgi:predicted dehydrogenase|nr:Gfo/Idh/MocA family oxidoreductase [Mycobacteriales bacterium]
MTTVSLVPGRVDDLTVRPLLAALRAAGIAVRERLLPGADVVLVLGAPDDATTDLLLAAGSRGTPVLVVGPQPGRLADAGGLLLGRRTPVHEVRVRPGPDAGEICARAGGELLVRESWPLVDKAADDVEVLLTANVAYADHPVATWRAATGVALLTVGSRPQTYDDRPWQRTVHRLVRHLAGERDADPARIGVLGYGAIGDEHSAAIAVTDGLELAAVCDPNPARVAAARALAPAVRGWTRAEDLLADDGVDLVIVSTPPDSHAEWTLRALSAGKSVVVEKPFCLTVEQADRQVAAAAERGLTLAVYQNRRWDPDYLALKRVVRSGQLGEVFHYESFLGGYGHPCNYWHSDEAVSGGAIYDWGSHFLDWVMDLFPQPVEWVSATTHKRVWHDVTNADHSRVLVHFEDGVEAEFTHSDLAAALKPKFYVLGTEGGLIGDWRYERVVGRSPIGTLLEDRLGHTDSPADLRLFTPDGVGGTSETRLSVPPAPPQPFHRELADQVLSGWPMSVTPAGSRKNIALMQAATTSAADGGRPVALPR